MMSNLNAEASRSPVPVTCPNCRQNGAERTFSLGKAPVMVCSAFAEASESRAVPVGELELATCVRCGFLFNSVFDQALALAGAEYESSQAASPHFNAFARALAKDWIERYGLQGKHVVEVGCGQGEFLAELIRAGAGSGVGVDPLFKPEFIAEELRGVIQVEALEFGPDHVKAPGDALVCRHAIEHIGDVAGFLAFVAQWVDAHPGAPVLFEAPASERIIAEGAFWDVFYEHCNYFTKHSLEDAFLRAGLDVKRCELVYDDQYLLIESVGLRPARIEAPAAQVNEALLASRTFADTVLAAVDEARSQIGVMALEGAPVVLWQGASKAVALMTSLGPDVPVAFAVDLNTRRHGQYLPPFALQVLPPSHLVEARPRHVVLLNAVYVKEVRAELDRLGLNQCQLHTINDVTTPVAKAA